MIGEAQVDVANSLFVDGQTLGGQLALERKQALEVIARKAHRIPHVVRHRVPLADEHFAAVLLRRPDAHDDLAGDEPLVRGVRLFIA